jgi:selenocysteine lyase/cysteine desulfurase
LLKHRFTRFLAPDRLHLAAHSHHLWPDVAFDAHVQAWLDAAERADDKWDRVFADLIPSAQGHIARTLGLSDPAAIAFAPNTHELVVRVASCLDRPFRVVTSDAEFHSFRRQLARWEESGDAEVVHIAARPYTTFTERFAQAVAEFGPELVYLSQVHYDSGHVTADLDAIVTAAPAEAFVVIDGYHGFMALPTDLGALEARAFYLAGGYKYAMSGEGAVFMHCPPGFGERPVDTGWYAGFGSLTSRDDAVGYAEGGGRFWGATFDPSPLYRFVAVMDMLGEEGVTVRDIHSHVTTLQQRFVAGLPAGPLRTQDLLPDWGMERGHFLTFQLEDAAAVYGGLHDRGVITDFRGDRFRVGFGVYHDDGDIDRALAVMGGLSESGG